MKNEKNQGFLLESVVKSGINNNLA